MNSVERFCDRVERRREGDIPAKEAQAMLRVIRAASWVRETLAARACPVKLCVEGSIPGGPDPDGHWIASQCECCAMAEEVDSALDALPGDDDA